MTADPWDPVDDRLDDDDDGLYDDDDRLDEDVRVAPLPPRFHDGMPIMGYHDGEPIPKLNAIPQERWPHVLRPLGQWTRRHALQTVDAARIGAAIAIVSGLMSEDADRRLRAEEAAPPRMPAGALPVSGPRRQVNFRLGPREHARLHEAAELFAMAPTTLARVLTMRGVDRALYEARRDA